MSLNLETVKNVAPNRNLFKKITALIISILVMIGSFIVINNANKEAKNTVTVLRVKTQEGIPARAVITEGDIEKYNLIEKEFTDDMFRAEDMSEVVNKYSKYFLRKNSIIYKDQLMKEKPLKNEWLYSLEQTHEVLTLPYNYLECGGDILIPGDKVRIRVCYSVDGGVPVLGGNPNLGGFGSSGKSTQTVVLFDSIVVKDMLNSNSHSIYEVYKEVSKLPEAKKQEVMKSDDFLKNIMPKALVLEGTKDQVTNYARYKSMENKTFLITILRRGESETILDQLPTLEKEVESWIEKQQN